RSRFAPDPADDSVANVGGSEHGEFGDLEAFGGTPSLGVSGSTEPEFRINYINSPWSKVLKDVAENTGCELVILDAPHGNFSRQDWRKHNSTEAIRILNQSLEPLGYRMIRKGEYLTVMAVERSRVEYPRREFALAPRRQASSDSAPESVDDRAQARRPESPALRPTEFPHAAQRHVDQSSAAAARPLAGGHSVAPPNLQPTPRSPFRDASIRPVDYVAGEGDEPAPTTDPIQLKLTPHSRSATDVARQLHRAFQRRATTIDAGPHGLPAIRVASGEAVGFLGEEADAIHDDTARAFVLELDVDNNVLWVEGPAGIARSLERLVMHLDQQQLPVGHSERLVSGTQKTAAVAEKLQPQLQRLLELRRQQQFLSETTPGADRAEPLWDRSPRRQWDTLAQADQSDAGTTNGQAAGSGAITPNGGNGAAGEQPPLGDDPIPALIGNLKGDVTLEALQDLDLLILRGNEKDVEQVMQVIRSIEQMAIGTAPEIHLLQLQHVNSDSLATLLEDVYERLSGLQTRGTAQSRRNVDIVAVGRPNAILIMAPETVMESIITLATELDQPVDPSAEVQVFSLRNAVASQVVTVLDDFFEERTGLGTRIKATADIRTNSVIVQARPTELAEVSLLIKKMDRDDAKSVNSMITIRLSHAAADELAEFLNATIQSILNPQTTSGLTGGLAGAGQAPQELRDSKAVVLEFLTQDGNAQRLIRSGLLSDIRINGDIRTNMLMITAPKQSLPLLEELVRLLDQPSAAVADIKVFTLKNSDASSAVDLLTELFSNNNSQGNQQGQQQLGIQIAGAEDASSSLVPLRFSTDVRTNSVIAVGGADALRMVEAILLRLDQSDASTRRNTVIKLRNSAAADVAAAITQFLDSRRQLLTLDPERISTSELLEQEVIVTPEPVSNSLLISATPRYFEDIYSMANELDREPAQVLIQALLVEVQLNDNDEFGVELGFQDDVLFDRSLIDAIQTISETTTLPTGVQTTTQRIISQSATPGFLFNNQQLGNNTAINPSAVGSQGLSSFNLGRVNSDLGFGGLVLSASSQNVSVLIRALASRRNVRVLSRPQVLALDNQTAQIQVGQRVPIVNGVTVTQTGSNPQIIQDEAGIILTVAPRISPEGQIVMEVTAEKSAFTGAEVPIFTDTTNGTVVTSPIKDITTARTSVKVPDGQTIILGGMITETSDNSERKVPWLGDLPIIGHAFRFDSHAHQRTELLIFLTPRIVHCDTDMEFMKQVEAGRLHYFQEEAESIHGPLFGLPQEQPWIDESALHPNDPELQLPTGKPDLLPPPEPLNSQPETSQPLPGSEFRSVP
ncbi:MAG: hypothetical protein KDA58_09460, partial [Planctomycetaceae bacterium]|nr:hypothetical protein [Planctomycetaceae bacterium]